MAARTSHAPVLALATALVALRSAPAGACQPGPWTQAPAYAAPAAVVPKNIPAAYFFPGFALGGGCTATGVTLSQLPSTPMALTASPVEPNTHQLSGELEEGASYVLGYSSSCLPNGPGQAAFVAGPSRPLPLQIGKLQLVASGTGSVSWWDGACNWGVTAAWARLKLVPSCDLVPFLPVTRFAVEVDGQLWWSSRVGSTKGNEVADNRTLDLVWLPCSAASSWQTASGKVVITLRAHIVGTTSDPASAQLTVPMSCDTSDASASPEPAKDGLVDLAEPCVSSLDASTQLPDSGTPDSGTPDSGAADVSVGDSGASDALLDDAGTGSDAPGASEPTPELQPTGGCACGTAPSSPELGRFAWIAAGLAAWLGRARVSKGDGHSRGRTPRRKKTAAL